VATGAALIATVFAAVYHAEIIAHRIGEYLEWKQRELGGERLGASPEHWRWRQRFAERAGMLLYSFRFLLS